MNRVSALSVLVAISTGSLERMGDGWVIVREQLLWES